MIVGIVVLWAGYTVALWGYVTVRGYCIGFRDLLNYKYPRNVLTAGATTPAATSSTAAASSTGSSTPAGVKFV